MSTQRTLLITGAAGRLGGPLARGLAKDGWRIALAHRNKDSAAETHALAKSLAIPCPILAADLSSSAAAETLVASLEATWGRIDALVHAAGSYTRTPLLKQSEAAWRKSFDDNLHSTFNICRAVSTPMKRQGFGRIITFGLAGAHHLSAQPHISAQTITKAGVLALTRTLASILGPSGVTANCIALGFIEGPTGGEAKDEAPASVLKGHIPAGRFGTPDDVLAAVRFLLRDNASYINGSEIVVSGGFGC
ncbi:MAG: SDR family oxidoreductase [Deltaproteobacteria bacterium]|nr:SDR family oxidoreductase [Deltaproteobacteria bacterium]